MTGWHPHCDAARVARWQAIDRERATQSDRSVSPPPEPPRPRPAQQERYERHRYGRAADGAGSGGGYRVLPGPRGGHA